MAELKRIRCEADAFLYYGIPVGRMGPGFMVAPTGSGMLADFLM